MRRPEIPTKIAMTLSALGLAALTVQGVIAEQQRQNQVQPNLPGVWEDAGAKPLKETEALPVQPLALNFNQELQKFLEAQDTQFKAIGKKPILVMTELVRIKVKKAEVNELSGINVRNSPDTKLGKPVLANGESKPPYWKVLPPDSDQGVFSKFILMQDEKTGNIDVWVPRQQAGQKELEFFAGRKDGQDLVDVSSESKDLVGQPLTVSDLLARFITPKVLNGHDGS